MNSTSGFQPQQNNKQLKHEADILLLKTCN